MNVKKSTDKVQTVTRTDTRILKRTTRTFPTPRITTQATNSGLRRTTTPLTKSTSYVSDGYFVKLCTASVGPAGSRSNSTNGTDAGVSIPSSTLVAGPSVSLSVIIGVALPLTAFLAAVVILFLRYRLHILTLRPNSAPAPEQCPGAPPAPSLSGPPTELKYSSVYTNVGRKPRDTIEPMDSYKSHRTTNIYMNICSAAERSPRGDHSYCNVLASSSVDAATMDDIGGVNKSGNVYTKLRDVSVVNVNPYNVFTDHVITDHVQNFEDTKAHLVDKQALPVTNNSIQSGDIEKMASANNDLNLSRNEIIYFEVEKEL